MLGLCLGAGSRTACRLLPTGQRLAFSRLLNYVAGSPAPLQAARRLTAEALADVSPTDWRPCYRAVLVDAAGTFLVPSEPVSSVYLRYARPHGCQLKDEEVLARFRRVYNMPWGESPLRYVGDARPFWRRVVEYSTGCEVPEVSEAIYEYYSRAEAWTVTPGFAEALQRLKAAGVLLAVVSNFDTRLRPLLRDLGVDGLFDAVIVSAEVHAEKPNPVIFDAAIRSLNAAATTRGTIPIAGLAQRPLPGPSSTQSYPVSNAHPPLTGFEPLISGQQRVAAACAPDFGPLFPEQVVHVGDDRRNDCWGARDAGITAWLWGSDVRSWAEVADRVLLGSQVDDYYDDLPDAAQN
ncbi:hypothetical protein PLESTF_000709800 [Pleodorina starrii]|nr:hypothetical protein PLESTM_001799000 [Pleodorina starrii]GLC68570.1 hypothetical protein PLESTF_000709800 [Pleodorina starrii]